MGKPTVDSVSALHTGHESAPRVSVRMAWDTSEGCSSSVPGTQEELVQSRHVVSTPETQTLRLTEAVLWNFYGWLPNAWPGP